MRDTSFGLIGCTFFRFGGQELGVDFRFRFCRESRALKNLQPKFRQKISLLFRGL